MNTSHTVCQIEHHAMMFAFLSKHAIRLCGNRGKDAILDAMTKYGKERGRRMALECTDTRGSAEYHDESGLRRVEA